MRISEFMLLRAINALKIASHERNKERYFWRESCWECVLIRLVASKNSVCDSHVVFFTNSVKPPKHSSGNTPSKPSLAGELMKTLKYLV